MTLGWERLTAVFVGLAATGIYTALAGLRGVVVSDIVLFAVATLGAWALAHFALAAAEVGGIDGLTRQLPAETFQLLPQFGAAPDGAQAFALPLTAFIAFLGLQWWASWYPGQEPGGGGYLAQRMMSAKDERHALLATLWFAVAHYCLRPWPWIVVALAALVLYPDLADRESGYALVMRDHLPAGWRGLMIGGFFAAYMSTVSTQLNWGTSYLINDVYARFLRARAGQRELVAASRVATLLVMLLSGLVTFHLEDVRQAWEFALESGAGIGLVLILRWYWWRVNAVSEIVALAASAAGFIGLRLFTAIAFPESLLYLVPWTTACWLAATWMTPPEPLSRLTAFYRRVRPGGPGWAPVAARVGGDRPGRIGGRLADWGAGILLVYGLLFAAGALLFGTAASASLWTALAVAGGAWLQRRGIR